MTYSKTGSFTNGGAPAISATFLNNVEQYLNPGVARSGVPLMSWFGPYTVTTTYTYFNHNLVDAAGSPLTPDIVLTQLHSNSALSLHDVYVDMLTMTSTQVKMGCDSGTDVVYGIALKF